MHGQDAIIGPWVGPERRLEVRMPLGASMPAVLKKLVGAPRDGVRTSIVQRKFVDTPTALEIKNEVTLHGLRGAGAFKVRPAFSVRTAPQNQTVTFRATVCVQASLPFPLSTVAESFLASRAKADIDSYVACVRQKLKDGRLRS